MKVFSTGDRVAHTQYGDGTVMRADEYHTVIDFDAHGIRTFSSPRVVLAPTTSVAVRPAGSRKRAARAPKAQKSA